MKFPVQYVGKVFRIVRWGVKFNQPFVGTFSAFIHENGGSRKFKHIGCGLFASAFEGFCGVVDDELFAECINKQFGASGDSEFIGLG